MEVEIIWLNNGFKQKRKLINYCRSGLQYKTFITMNSPIYEAIADGSFCLDTGYGKHPFEIKELNSL